MLTRPAWPGRGSRLFAEGLTVAACATAAAAAVMRLWEVAPRTPMYYRGDGVFYAVLTKAVVTRGWYHEVPQLGDPHGLVMHDFPLGAENFHVLQLKLLALLLAPFDPGWPLVLNSFYVLTFATCALSAHVVLRCFGVGRAVALVGSVTFATLPYHFVENFYQQPFLADYYVVPLGVLLVRRQLARPAGDRAVARLLGGTRREVAGALAIAVLLGASSPYYLAFTGCLLAAVAAFRVITDRAVAPAVAAGLLLLVAGTTFAVNNLPTLRYRHEHGTNPVAAERAIGETQRYAVSVPHLVLPVPEGDVLPDLTRRASDVPLPPIPQALGYVGAAGFVGLLGYGLLGAAGRRRVTEHERLLAHLSALTIGCVLLSVTGGANLLVALATPIFRSWYRMSVFIGFLAVAAGAVAADRWVARRRTVRARRGATAAVAVVAGAALVAQYAPWMTPDYVAAAAAFGADRATVEQLAATVGPRARVFQLPVVPFPEAGLVHELVDYDQARGYLHSDTLRWSYGGMRGRAADWHAAVAGLPTRRLVALAAAAGFDAVWVERAAYPDRGRAVRRDVAAVTRGQFVESPDGRVAWLDLRPYRDRLTAVAGADVVAAARAGLLAPVRAYPGRGFGPPEPGGDRPAERAASIGLVNDASYQRMVTVRVAVTPAGSALPLVLTGPGGAAARHLVPERGGMVELTLPLPPGEHELRLATTSQVRREYFSARATAFRVGQVQVAEAAYEALWDALGLS